MSVLDQCILCQCPFRICVPELVSWLTLYIHIGFSVWICVFILLDGYTKPRNINISENKVNNVESIFVFLETCGLKYFHYVYCEFAKMETHYMGLNCKS